MKIAFVNDSFLKGRGADTVIYELARRLGKKHEVIVVCGKSDFKEENFKIKKIGFDKIATGTVKDFLGFLKLKNFRNSCKDCDIINLHHTTLTSAFLGIKNVFVTSHGFPKRSEKNIIRLIFRFLANWFNVFMLNFTHKTIAISKYIKNDLIKKGVNSKRIVVINDGVSEEFKPTWEDRGYMLFVGRQEPHKKINELIKLSKELDFPLLIVGSGPLTKNLINYIKEIKAKKVKILGKISRRKLIKLYQECSFFVSTSIWEGFGLIFLEAAASGKPSVAYNLCSIPEVVSNKKTGFLVKDFDEFKEKTILLIKDKKLRQDMGREAFKFSKNFSWENKVKEYEKEFINKK